MFGALSPDSSPPHKLPLLGRLSPGTQAYDRRRPAQTAAPALTRNGALS